MVFQCLVWYYPMSQCKRLWKSSWSFNCPKLASISQDISEPQIFHIEEKVNQKSCFELFWAFLLGVFIIWMTSDNGGSGLRTSQICVKLSNSCPHQIWITSTWRKHWKPTNINWIAWQRGRSLTLKETYVVGRT